MYFKNIITLAITLLFFPTLNATSASTDNDMVYWHKDDKGKVSFIGDNPHPIPYTIELKLSLENMHPSEKAPFIFTLKAHSKKNSLFSLTPVKNASYRFSVATRVVPGLGINTHHQDEFLYLLPFEHGKKNQVGQGYFGSTTHKQPNPYAIDFSMDTGSVVSAARGGIVMQVKQDSNTGGPDAKYAKHANYVIIFHDDGSFGNYAHFKQGGALVKKGQVVQAGQPIGLSGNTGQSSGPHLHFDVYTYNAKGQSRNLPVKFISHQQRALTTLNSGQFYYSQHPNKPAFKVTLGADMTNEDVQKISPKAFNDEFKITTKSIDDTILFYANNGTHSTIGIELEFELQNLTSSRLSPIKISVPPLSKQFITLLKPVNRTKSRQYSYSLTQQVMMRTSSQ